MVPRPKFRDFSAPINSDEDKLARAQFMKIMSEDAEEYQERCIEGEKVFYCPDTEARMPGHITSRAGMDEYCNSRLCEFHYAKQWEP